jgi:glycosyltransferase involved in cell wall biosynthesis
VKIGYLCADAEVEVLGDEGCSVHVREMVNAMAEIGHEVFIVCAWAGGTRDVELRARVHELQPAGVDAEIWRSLADEPLVQDHHLDRDLRSILWSYWLTTAGLEIFERERAELIYERYSMFGFGGEQVARKLGVPWILEVNAPLTREQAGYHRFTLPLLAARLEASLVARADAAIVITSSIERWAIEQGASPERVHVVPNGVSNRLFAAQLDGDMVRRRLGLEGKRVVGFVGSFQWWHDVHGLIDAFATLHARDPESRLLLVGAGENLEQLEQRVRERALDGVVVFAGRVPHHQVPHHFAAMDVAVVPNQPIEDFFGSPMKLFEAMAAGRPTVVADLGDNSRIVAHGETGWLYPPGDTAKLAEGIATLLTRPELAAEIGAAARRRVLAAHTWEATARRVVELARGVAARSAS